jgi:predicted ATPase
LNEPDGGNASRFVVISGCSGGGKSTVLAELARRGYAVVPEPGRRVVEEEVAANGRALPWVDLTVFLARVVDLARADLAAPHGPGWVFFDRGLFDAAVALAHVKGTPIRETLRDAPGFYRRVFLTPPWPEIYVQDASRRHDLASARAEYDRLLAAYPAQGYEVNLLPKTGVAARADFILDTLRMDSTSIR